MAFEEMLFPRERKYSNQSKYDRVNDRLEEERRIKEIRGDEYLNNTERDWHESHMRVYGD